MINNAKRTQILVEKFKLDEGMCKHGRMSSIYTKNIIFYMMLRLDNGLPSQNGSVYLIESALL